MKVRMVEIEIETENETENETGEPFLTTRSKEIRMEGRKGTEVR